MSDSADQAPDYRATVFLPKTDFPMKAGLAQKEPAILAEWETADLYGQVRAKRNGKPRYILHDGPPYANGDIHMGHALNKVLKDIIVRSKTLQGFDAPYIPGWDCHGLPIEWKVEEQYRAKKLDKDAVDPIAFRAECRAYAEKWVDVQRGQFKRLGVLGRWDDPYLTMKYEAEAVIAGELLKFAETGQLYRGAKPVMWSPVEKTALAEAEVEYEDITSTQIDVGFEIVDSPIKELIGAHAVIWTTTPWTIPVNQAIAYGPEVEYVAVRAGGRVFLAAQELLNSTLQRAESSPWLSEGSGWTVTWAGKGSELAGTIARHPMHERGGFFAKPRPFLPGEFVTTDTGTGLVHMAPDHGEDDFELCKANGIDPVFAVRDDGRYREDWAWQGGQSLSVINPKLNAPEGPICSDLREAGALLAASYDYKHSYPHSWRSKAKIIFRCTPQWFIAMDRAIGEKLVRAEPVEAPAEPSALALRQAQGERPDSLGHSETGGKTLRQIAERAIKQTRWVPERSRNRIGTMVAGRPDWVISRQRAWGVPIALYVNRKTGEYLRDEAVNARILEAFKAGGADAWYTADHQELLGNSYSLDDYEVVRDILDVWFDSGSTHAFVVEPNYPGLIADLYVEGSDQHRGWFQSSLLESSGTRGRAPYQAVLTHGFALDGQGRKMSKSVGNVVDPLKIMDQSGADILRLWVASTDYFDDVRISNEVLAGASDGYRKLRNTFRYLLGALSDFDAEEWTGDEELPELERWVQHRLAELDAELKAAVEAYEFNRYVTALSTFANNDLSAFFFDIRKDVLYCDGQASPVRQAYRTVLDQVFHALVRWFAPILVFTTEEVWKSRFDGVGGSIHLESWPVIPEGWRNDELAARWNRLRDIRFVVTNAIEPLRREKVIGSSLDAKVTLALGSTEDRALVASVPFADIAIVSELEVVSTREGSMHTVEGVEGVGVHVEPTARHKCGRCWRKLPEVVDDGALCDRCGDVVHG
ncbi:isoleucine--tRNA ligase [Sphingomonas sp. ID0503]|uniref:isoleucine--tRNA ligase n=1 Tax=Sphingomonas sp. ID0503 TaxID=3399691 RepID=UPI003AFAB60E